MSKEQMTPQATDRSKDIMNEPKNECLVYIQQWQEKLGWKIFPNTYVDSPELPEMKDVIVSYTRVNLSFIDRLRVLISGKIEITTKTATENIIGAVKTNCGSSVRPPWWLDRVDRKSKDIK